MTSSIAEKVDLGTNTDWLATAREIGAFCALRAAEHDSNDSFVSEGYAELKKKGFFSATVPTEFGGGGIAYADLCNSVRILAQHCGSTALAFAMHSHVVATAAWRWRNEKAPVEGLLKRVAGEGLVMVSSGGSDWLNGSGTAEKVEGGYKITGRKVFASGSPEGDLLATAAVYEDPQAGPTVLHFAVPLKHPTVKHVGNWQVLGMRGTGSQDIVIDGFVVPEAAISGRRPAGKWHPLFHAISMVAFPIIYSAYVGLAQAARDLALESAKRKKADPAVQIAVGELENALYTAEIAIADMISIAETSGTGPATTNRIFKGRALVAKSAIETVTKALEISSGFGFYRQAGLERIFRDIQAARFHPLQEKPQLMLAGRQALDLPIDA